MLKNETATFMNIRYRNRNIPPITEVTDDESTRFLFPLSQWWVLGREIIWLSDVSDVGALGS